MKIETNLTVAKVTNFKTFIEGGYTLESGFGIAGPDGALAADSTGAPMLFKLKRTAKTVALGGLIAPVHFVASA